MKNNVIGFLLSGMLHAGLFGSVVILSKEPKKETKPTDNIALTVSMFKEKVAPPVIEKSVVKKPVVIKAKKPIEKVVEKPIEKKAEQAVQPAVITVVKQAPIPKIEKEQPKPEPKIKPEKIIKPIIADIVEPKKAVILKPKIAKAEIEPKKKIIKKVVKKKITKKKIVKRIIKKKKIVKVVKKKSKVVRAKRPVHQPVRKVVKKKKVVRKKLVVAKRKVQARRAPAQVRRAPVRKPVRRAIATHAKRPVVRKALPRKYLKKAVPQRHKVAPRATIPSPQAAQLSRKYQAKLRQLIISNKRYPKRAKRRNQQGKVTLSFTIRHSGVIDNIRVVKSSNISSLDKAAIQAIAKSTKKLPFFAGMSKKTLALTLTLNYILR